MSSLFNAKPPPPRSSGFADPTAPACEACGALARRTSARFCSVCGRRLGGGYFPSDSLRASYRLTGGFSLVPDTPTMKAAPPRPRPINVPRKNLNESSTIALAFVTYSLVPYLGIIFCPAAIFMGGLALVRWRRAPHLGGQQSALVGVVMGFVVFCAQLFLWWILYKIPQWAEPW